MNELLGKKLTPSDVISTSNNVNRISISASSFGYLTLKIDYTTTGYNQLAYIEFDGNTIDGIGLNYATTTTIIYASYEEKRYALEISSTGSVKNKEYLDDTFNKDLETYTIPKWRDLIVYKKELPINENGISICEIRIKNGEINEYEGIRFDECICSINKEHCSLGIGHSVM